MKIKQAAMAAIVHSTECEEINSIIKTDAHSIITIMTLLIGDYRKKSVL